MGSEGAGAAVVDGGEQRRSKRRHDELTPDAAAPERDTALRRAHRAPSPGVPDLLPAGRDSPPLPDDGTTALHTAAGAGDVAAVDTLVAANADVNALNLACETPLYCAAERGAPRAAAPPDCRSRGAPGHTVVVRRLLRLGAATHVPARTGLTATMAACAAGHLDPVWELLTWDEPTARPQVAAIAAHIRQRQAAIPDAVVAAAAASAGAISHRAVSVEATRHVGIVAALFLQTAVGLAAAACRSHSENAVKPEHCTRALQQMGATLPAATSTPAAEHIPGAIHAYIDAWVERRK